MIIKQYDNDNYAIFSISCIRKIRYNDDDAQHQSMLNKFWYQSVSLIDRLNTINAPSDNYELW